MAEQIVLDQYNFVGLRDDMLFPYFCEAQPEAQQEVAAETLRQRAIVDSVPHDERGINLTQVGEFLSSYGLEPQDTRMISKADYLKLAANFGSNEDDGIAGVHYPILERNLVVRDISTSTHATQVAEMVAVHEATHANQFSKDILFVANHPDEDIRSYGYIGLRHGFRLGEDIEGSYFEEGFADLMAQKYVVEALGKAYGLLDRREPQIIAPAIDYDYLIPGRSLFYRFDSDVLPKWTTPSHAAYGLQLLIAKDPKIFAAALQARTDVDGLREFARRVERLDEGLYRSLRNRPYEHISFLAGTAHIIDCLYDGDQEAALKAADEVMLSGITAAA